MRHRNYEDLLNLRPNGLRWFCFRLLLSARFCRLPRFSLGFLRTQTLPSHMYLLDSVEHSEKHPKKFERYKAIEKEQYSQDNAMCNANLTLSIRCETTVSYVHIYSHQFCDVWSILVGSE
ncbi:hypothetical protein DEO72_LG7g3032 [Vigna unguiculata]|uniref:Uncharacterized protein n=1 Tax=Vigna unguiculata TaxID=3917 RepID=A0A4D6MM83_VIGUN|nr:hypothetical protein DEO72_LG7g3032 [Vigna unguiculata]